MLLDDLVERIIDEQENSDPLDSSGDATRSADYGEKRSLLGHCQVSRDRYLV